MEGRYLEDGGGAVAAYDQVRASALEALRTADAFVLHTWSDAGEDNVSKGTAGACRLWPAPVFLMSALGAVVELAESAVDGAMAALMSAIESEEEEEERE